MIPIRKCKSCRQIIPVKKERIKNCENCNDEYVPRLNKMDTSRYCSKECKMSGLGKISQLALKAEWDLIGFEKHAKLTLEPFIQRTEGCWIWIGKGRSSRLPYGRINFRGKTVMAHRLSYQAYKGEIPEGLLVLHKCDNPECVNPDHLYIGTYLDNQRDKRERNRCNGEKLTEEQVREIKKELKLHDQQENRKGKYSLRKIGNRFNVSGTMVKQIKDGISWSWVEIE